MSQIQQGANTKRVQNDWPWVCNTRNGEEKIPFRAGVLANILFTKLKTFY